MLAATYWQRPRNAGLFAERAGRAFDTLPGPLPWDLRAPLALGPTPWTPGQGEGESAADARRSMLHTICIYYYMRRHAVCSLFTWQYEVYRVRQAQGANTGYRKDNNIIQIQSHLCEAAGVVIFYLRFFCMYYTQRPRLQRYTEAQRRGGKSEGNE